MTHQPDERASQTPSGGSHPTLMLRPGEFLARQEEKLIGLLTAAHIQSAHLRGEIQTGASIEAAHHRAHEDLDPTGRPRGRHEHPDWLDTELERIWQETQ